MSINTEDPDELRFQANEVLALVHLLRPSPHAKLMSKKMVMLIAILAGNRDLVEIVKGADRRTLFWEVDGEYIQTRISVEEFPAS